jgi:hypothetical protein
MQFLSLSLHSSFTALRPVELSLSYSTKCLTNERVIKRENCNFNVLMQQSNNTFYALRASLCTASHRDSFITLRNIVRERENFFSLCICDWINHIALLYVRAARERERSKFKANLMMMAFQHILYESYHYVNNMA